MKYVKFIVRVLFLTAVTASFFGVPMCWLSVKVQGLLWGLVASLLFGRFFCEAVCPLGVVQSFVNWAFHPKSHVRRVCTRLPETRGQRLVRWSIVALCVALFASGCTGAMTMVLPISIFGKALTLWYPGVAVFVVVLLLAVFGQGRIWCNWICPFGTLYNLVSKVSIFKNKVGNGCGSCRRCFETKKPVSATADAQGDGVGRREVLKGVTAVAVADKLADGGLAEVSLPGVPNRGSDILPPGAGSRRHYLSRCVGCQLCVSNCQGQCLKPSKKFATFGQPLMDFRTGYCLIGCTKCTEVCPEGALTRLQADQRPNVHVGYAVWQKDICVRTTNGDACTACVRKCPVRAIHIVQGFPVVDRDKCIGCGACEHVCPSRPMPAIYVKGYDMQRVVNPISESDLLAEMRKRIEDGMSVVVAVGGVIVAEEQGSGIGPLVKLHDAGRLRDAIVMDKIIGRAAAALCAHGGAKKVFAMLSGKGAAELLESRGIFFKSDKTVEVILNHAQKDSCPMEKAVKGLDEPEAMIEAIRKAMKK